MVFSVFFSHTHTRARFLSTTRVQAAESRMYLATDQWLDICTSEIITCEKDTLGCDGGWPQNAFDYLEDKGEAIWEESGSCSGEDFEELGVTLETYEKEDVCSTFKNDGEGSSSKDSKDSGSRDGDRLPRFKGYTYATEPCVCYSSGSGCACRNQDEDKMAQNVATYGPATICVDGTNLRNYVGGIMQAESIGCSSEFLAMNHCLIVIGYSLADEGDDDGVSYWIVKNQWGNSWGDNGVAYIEFGYNSCGIANDVTLAKVEV